MRLENKVALISGGARGMGAVEAKLFSVEGAKVVIGDVLEEEGRRTEAEINEAGGECLFVPLDVTSESQWQAAVEAAVSRFGKLDILVNNAGIYRTERVEEISEELWDQVMGINAKGVFLGTKHAIPEMRNAGGGSIINISSVTWMMGRPFRLDYVTSKAGVVGLTHAIAPELGEFDINVNAVVLGLVQSDSALKVYGAEHFQKFKERQVFKRSLTPQDACGAVVFLASDDAEMITGQSLVVDGGLVFH
mgnify:CR=1 FL=1